MTWWYYCWWCFCLAVRGAIDRIRTWRSRKWLRVAVVSCILGGPCYKKKVRRDGATLLSPCLWSCSTSFHGTWIQFSFCRGLQWSCKRQGGVASGHVYLNRYIFGSVEIPVFHLKQTALSHGDFCRMGSYHTYPWYRGQRRWGMVKCSGITATTAVGLNVHHSDVYFFRCCYCCH
jgi:hypothetical protein